MENNNKVITGTRYNASGCENWSNLPEHGLTHKSELYIGQIVYLKTDPAQAERMVIGINISPDNSVTYCLVFETLESWHYLIEISLEKDIIKATTG